MAFLLEGRNIIDDKNLLVPLSLYDLLHTAHHEAKPRHTDQRHCHCLSNESHNTDVHLRNLLCVVFQKYKLLDVIRLILSKAGQALNALV